MDLLRVRHVLAASALTLLLPAALASCGSPAPPGPTSATTSTSSAVPSGAAPSGASDPGTAVPVETAPPGDIPDNLAFVRYDNAAGHYSFTHPEGWAQTEAGSNVRFTDKLNSVAVDSQSSAQAPTVSGVRSGEVARLSAQVPAFELRDVTSASLPGGAAVKVVFRRNSDPDPVTGKVYRDEVEEYLVFRAGRLVRMDLSGPVGADNVDAYRTMSRSLEIR
jgi:hypothetical protein